MTVRIAQDLGIKKIVNFSKQLGIYDNPKELLSIALGSAETTLLKLTSAYSSFVNGGKLVKPIMIDRIQDSEGNTIFNNEKRKCINCDQLSFLSENYPKIEDDFTQIFSAETAYQMTSILEGVVQNGTGKNLKDLNLDLAGKTGTTNKNNDAWFMGFTSKLAIGVYVGSDNPKSLGKYETGAKTALPIFKSFVKKAVNKEEARPFKVANNILMMVIDPKTGKKSVTKSKKTIIEVYKKMPNENNLNLNNKNRFKNTNILKFY
jgi:penicillin-binding protein 1A